MAARHITAAESVVEAADNTAAFSDNSNRSVILDPGAYLIAKGSGGFGMDLDGVGAWSVQIKGSVYSLKSLAISFSTGFAATLTIGVEGEVRSDGTGAIDGRAIFFGDAATFTNAGKVVSAVSAIDAEGFGNTTITNSGEIIGGNDGITFFSGSGASHVNTLVNSGTVKGGAFSVIGKDSIGIEHITNTGLLDGRIDLGRGKDTLANGGTVLGNVVMGDGGDTITNFVKVGSKTLNGSISGTVDLGKGDDKFTGSSGAETVKDSKGSDTIKLGGGADTYVAVGAGSGDGADSVDGGDGVDLYKANGTDIDLTINLDSVAHDEDGFGLDRASGANLAANIDIGTDTVTNFENALGGAGKDAIFGSVAANRLNGGGEDDDLFGFDGDDTLTGGGGEDYLVGGKGRDTLIGGAAHDAFFYAKISDSGVTRATRDVITDFSRGESDHIDLGKIDAKSGGSDNPFDFLGTNQVFTGQKGELRAYWTASGQIVEGDTTGDGKADFSILLKDLDPSFVLAEGHFVL